MELMCQDLEDVENPVVRIDEDGNERSEEWREYATWTTSQFFEKLTKEYEELRLVSRFLVVLRG